MKFTQIEIENATDEQLKKFAMSYLQLEVDGEPSREHILSLISMAWNAPMIFVEVTGDPFAGFDDEERAAMKQSDATGSSAQQRLIGRVLPGEPVVEIQISQTSLPGGRDPVPVGVNGQTVVIQRDMRVRLPYRFYAALENAELQLIEHQPNPDGHGFIQHATNTSNYPMRIFSMPTPEEIAEWHSKVDELEIA